MLLTIIKLGRLPESRRRVLELRIEAESAESSHLYHCSEFVARTKMERRHRHSNGTTGRHLKGALPIMRRLIGIFILLSVGFWGQPANAQGLLGGLLSTVGQ